MDQYLRYADGPDRGTLYSTASAQAKYWPVGLTQIDLGLQYGSPDSVAEDFRQELAVLSDVIVSDYRERAESGRKQDYSRLGIAYCRLGQYGMAVNAFESALLADPEYRSARVNLANVQFLLNISRAATVRGARPRSPVLRCSSSAKTTSKSFGPRTRPGLVFILLTGLRLSSHNWAAAL
jgi:hypothetical protein